MAIRTTRECDRLLKGNHVCGKPATAPFAGTIGKVRLDGDFCEEHGHDLQRSLIALGLTARVLIDSKPRQTHLADSGERFSTADARAWLVEQKLVKQSVGRVSAAHLRLYAEAH